MVAILPKKGQLLISEPAIDGNDIFNRVVILLAEHNSDGSVGFILNKPYHYTLNDLVPEISAEFSIFNGGPVEQENLYFIHTIPDIIPNSIEIAQGIYWGGDFEIMTRNINEGKVTKNDIRFFLGYTGWKLAQLESELQNKNWVITENTHSNKILSQNTKKLWNKQIFELGGDYILFSNAPADPIFN